MLIGLAKIHRKENIYIYTRKEFKVNEVMDSAKMPQKIALKRVKRLNF